MSPVFAIKRMSSVAFLPLAATILKASFRFSLTMILLSGRMGDGRVFGSTGVIGRSSVLSRSFFSVVVSGVGAIKLCRLAAVTRLFNLLRMACLMYVSGSDSNESRCFHK